MSAEPVVPRQLTSGMVAKVLERLSHLFPGRLLAPDRVRFDGSVEVTVVSSKRSGHVRIVLHVFDGVVRVPTPFKTVHQTIMVDVGTVPALVRALHNAISLMCEIADDLELKQAPGDDYNTVRATTWHEHGRTTHEID